MADRALDIRGLICPVTWARVRRELQTMRSGERLAVVLDHRPAVSDIRRNATELGHDIGRVDEGPPGTWNLLIELGSPD